MAIRPYPKMADTSLSADNLSDNLWPELAKWQSRSRFLTETSCVRRGRPPAGGHALVCTPITSCSFSMNRARIPANTEETEEFDPEKLLNMSFPPEILELIKENVHRIGDMDGFRKQFSKLNAAEPLLFEHQLKHPHETLPDYKRNMDEVRKRMAEDYPANASRVGETETALGLLPNIIVYSVVRAPFVLILTTGSSGELQLRQLDPSIIDALDTVVKHWICAVSLQLSHRPCSPS
jgi:hypothetical protein